jgi:hypothetical protein
MSIGSRKQRQRHSPPTVLQKVDESVHFLLLYNLPSVTNDFSFSTLCSSIRYDLRKTYSERMQNVTINFKLLVNKATKQVQIGKGKTNDKATKN